MLVPKVSKKIDLKIHKNIHLFDLLYMILTLLLSFFIFWYIPDLNNIVKIALTLVLALPLWSLIIRSKKHKCKLYVLLWRMFNFQTAIKKYDKEKDNLELDKKYSIEKDTVYFKQFKFSKNYIKIFEVNGFELEGYSESERDKKLISFKKVIEENFKTVTIIKLRENEILEENNLFFKKIIAPQNKQLLSSYKQDFQELLKGKNKINKYYIVISNPELAELNFDIKKLESNFNILNFKSRLLNVSETLNLLLKVNLNINEGLKNDDSDEKNILSNFNKIVSKLKVKYSSSQINLKNQFMKIQKIESLPFELNHGWAKKIFSLDCDVVWHLNRLGEEDSATLINRSLNNTKVNLTNSKVQTEIDYEKYKIEVLEKLSKRIISSNENLYSSSIFLINKNFNQNDLKQKSREIRTKLHTLGIDVWDGDFLQKELFSSVFFHSVLNIKTNNLYLPSSTTAESWPFYTSNFNDGNLLYLGKSMIGENVVFDKFNLSNGRKNSNSIIFGTSGSGKSTFAKKVISYNLSINNKVIIIDPENEYKEFTKAHNGSRLNLYADENISFNPLELRNFSDDYQKDFAIHIDWLKKWFITLYPSIDDYELFFLLKILKKIYLDYEDKIISEREFPLIDNLITYIDEEDDKLLISKMLKNDFQNHGKYQKLYNQKSSVTFDKNLTTINVKNIYEANDKNILLNSFFTILNYVQSEINSQRDKNNNLIVFIDEAHLLVDESNLIVLDFLFKMSKTIRKYKGSLMLATQNPSDFILSNEAARKSKAIISNTQFSFFFNLKSMDIEIIDDFYKYSGGLSEDEKLFLLKAAKGEIIFGFNPHERRKLLVNYNETEKKYCF
ncbi:Mbov_0397 family ICE element conjugal transfer ATPase [Mycoplasmopsis agassizii]|uniref:DUF87 domain-containing protein n=1 Tax=Mycoplasmopsis agassizii TaxID=33922 RepID=A0ABX4H5J0_9BACT|nr:ATP-binding protein [Mycoplasmopsis agassizii]PAF55118.1 DUF87 domain-containing protein [Mycoplasmopsis agassizii]SMC16596.1 AAA-like domain-containing protein [Mycoplasmopsis agassizii]